MSEPVDEPTLSGKRRKTLAALCVWVLLAVACVWAWIPTFSNVSNTLEHNGRWRVGKMELADGMMGAKSFYEESQALAGQCLNLGAWHGFQRVIMKNTLRANTLEFRFCFSQKDSLFILLNYTDEGFDALKIPSDPLESAALHHVKFTGEFLSTKTFSLPGRNSRTWNTAKLILEPERVGVSVNGGADTWLDLHVNTEQNFGFQSGLNGVLVDDIVARLVSGQVLFSESFDNEHNRRPIQQWFLLAICGGSLILALGMRIIRFSITSILSNLIALQISLIASGIVISQFYVPTLSGKYQNVGLLMMHNEEKVISANAQYIFRDLKKRYPDKASAETIRIIVVGTSQTSGAGAIKLTEGFVEQLDVLLNKSGSDCHFECIKFGCFGSWSKPLLGYYKKLVPTMMPDVCVVNLSCNDGSDNRRASFAEHLKEFAEFNRGHGIETVFVKEALCVEAFPKYENHVIMQTVADELGVPIVDSHRTLGEHMNDGFLWWDFVHPTNFGHSLIAEAIAGTLQKDVLPKLCKK